MIDIHSHIVFGVDDGPTTIEESIRMVSEAHKMGIKAIIATPHFQKEIFETDKIVENYNKLVKSTKEYDISILLGYEVFINPFLPDMVANHKIMTLNNSGYLLLELPFDSIPIYTNEIIYKLQLLNITPVIAHPERNRNLIKSFDKFLGLLERGCLVQVDAGSVLGVYGRGSKDFAKKLIKNNMVHFVASDAHSAKDYTERYLEAQRVIRKWAGEAYTDKLFIKNASVILEDVKESIYEMI